MMKKETVNSGLSLTLVGESTSKNATLFNSIINFLTRFLIVFALSAGSIFTFSSMMNFKQTEWINYCLIVVCSCAFEVIYKFVKKHNLVLIISIGLILAAGLLMLDNTVTGFKLLYDQGVESACTAMYWTAPDKLMEWEDALISSTTYSLALISVLITSLVAYFVVAKTQFIGAFLVTFPLFCVGTIFACVADKLPFSLLLSAWGAMLVLHISNRQKNTIRHKNADKKNTEREFVYEKKNSRFGGSALVMAVAIFLVFTLTTNVLVSVGYSKGESLETLRKTIKKSTLNVYDLITGTDHDASLKDGDLSELGDRKIQGRNYVTVQMPNLKEVIYLKGFVGSVYTGSKWEEFDKETYKNIAGIKKYFADVNYYLPTITGDLLYTDFDEEKVETAEFKLYDFRREKPFAYAPNGVISSPSITGYEDSYAKPEYSDSYSYRSYYKLSDYLAIAHTSGYNSSYFKGYWDAYCGFVYNNYCFLPSEGVEEITNLSRELQGETIYKTVDNVRAFLSQNTEYSNYAQKLAEGKDFATQFLFDNGKGYSPHFATSAAVILRALGVPTRYVEGYRIAPQLISVAQGNEQLKTLTLTDGEQHAWIEIFHKDYGWVPVEVTNGFYSGSFEDMFKQAEQEAEKLKQEEEEEEQTDEPSSDDPFANAGDSGESEAVEEVEDDDLKEYKENNILLILLIVLGVILALAIVCAIVLVIRRVIILKKRNDFFTKQVFNNDDYRKQIILAFNLIVRMLKFLKVDVEKTASFDEFKELLKNNFYTFSESEIDLDETMRIYEKAMFSKLLMSEGDSDKVLDLLDEFSFDVSGRLTFFQRLKWMFIDVLS